MVRPPLRRRAHGQPAAAVGLALAVVVVVGVSCGDEPEPTVAAYCAEVGANLDSLVSPAISTSADVDPLIDRYRSIAAVAPATVEPEWQTVITALEAAAAVVAGDPATMEEASRAALAGQPAYTRIQQYTQTQCGIAIGTPPPPTNPVTATTVVPPSSEGSLPSSVGG
ncbi:MAG: hypothetical protein KDB40_07920 [Acidimicrobiales bacterium]|nr:hypothetical protein [Acidimicrobiales bacterium]MCB9394690.1 hypothetical protein [Acidimicrobiaceae bacterium]